MKRCWFGGGLLIFLLIAGLLMSRFMDRVHGQMVETMTQASVLTEEQRSEAQAAVDRARHQWEKHRWLTAVLNDHDPMESIEEQFCLLTPEAEEKDFRETCLRLAAQLKALGESQRLTLENLF